MLKNSSISLETFGPAYPSRRFGGFCKMFSENIEPPNICAEVRVILRVN